MKPSSLTFLCTAHVLVVFFRLPRKVITWIGWFLPFVFAACCFTWVKRICDEVAEFLARAFKESRQKVWLVCRLGYLAKLNSSGFEQHYYTLSMTHLINHDDSTDRTVTPSDPMGGLGSPY
eukprot:767458-Hanusia_phi.AAC.3